MPATPQSSGEINAAVATVYRLCDEPSIRAKYSNSTMVGLLSDSWPLVLTDVYNQAQNPPLARYSITTVAGQRYYQLPPCIGEIIGLRNRSDVDHSIVSEMVPYARLSPYGPGWAVEGGQRLLIQPDLASDYTFEVEYIPSGNIALVQGTTSIDGSNIATASTLELETAVSGTIDARPKAYDGCVLSIYGWSGVLPSGYVRWPILQQVISSYDVATGVVTVEPDFLVNLAQLGVVSPAATLSWEIYPVEAPMIWPVVSIYTARKIAAFENKMERYKMLTQMYSEALRATCLRWANIQTRTPNHLERRSPDNPDYVVWGL